MARLTPDGVLVVDKPEGPTSHDIVAGARRLYATRSIGHAGTLDPMATGVLLLMFGEATKLSSYLTSQDKVYRAEVVFGRSTDSLDATGTTSAELALTKGWCSRDRLERALDHERERQRQQPPTLSAIKVAGRPAHRRVRSGDTPTLVDRAVRVHELTLLEFDGQRASLELKVSKGYYVRALARDLGDQLGVPAHLSRLRRTHSGPWTLAEARSWPMTEPVPLTSLRDAALRCLPWRRLTETGALRCAHGKLLGEEHFADAPSKSETQVSAWLGPGGNLLALGREQEPGSYRVVRGFRQGQPSGTQL